MKILYVVHQFFPEFKSGTEIVTLGLCRTLQLAGNSVTVFTCNFSDQTQGGSNYLRHHTYEGIPVYSVHRSNLPDSSDISLESFAHNQEVVDLIKHGEFDICHVMHPMRMVPIIELVIQFGIPYIVTLTDFFFDCYLVNRINYQNEYCPSSEGGKRCATTCLGGWDKKELIERHKKAAKILSGAVFRACPSSFVKRVFERNYSNLEFNIIPHGMHFADIQPGLMQSNTDNEILTLGFIGSIIEIKGLHVLLDAFGKIDSQEIKLIVAGKLIPGTGYASNIESMINSDDRVEYMGEINHKEVFSILNEIDLLCMPSLVPEAASIAFSEAMICGTPVLGSDIGFIKESLEKSGAGVLAKRGDVEHWKTSIIKLIRSPQLLKEMSCKTTMPLRVEEEAYYYEALYRDIVEIKGTL
ncbi:MAG: glycosyltransferase family 4 protein [Cyclobacteriaceae bacterium]